MKMKKNRDKKLKKAEELLELEAPSVDNKFRTSDRLTVKTIKILLFFFSITYLFMAGFGVFSSELNRGLYLLLTLVLVFLVYPIRRGGEKEKPVVLDWVLALLAVLSVGYWILEFPSFAYRIGNPTGVDILTGSVLLVLCFEAARRVLGYTLPIIGLVFLLYVLLGQYFPGLLAHRGYAYGRTVEYLAWSMHGIYGIVLDTYATYILLFIIFAGFLTVSGAGEALIKLSNSLTGWSRGGPAKIAVVASGIMGSITGAPAANTAATGAYTIPLMKKAGFQAHIAGGIEAAASTGGCFMPPIMGAAAFILAALTETPYFEIVKLAVAPALLYYVAIFIMVHLQSCKMNIPAVPKEERMPLKEAVSGSSIVIIPILLIIYLIFKGASPNRAAFWAVIAVVALSFLKKESRMGPDKLFEALVSGARSSLVVGSSAGIIGIIMGSVTITGLGLKFASLISTASFGFLPLAVVLVAICAYFLGMGLTITASYVILAIVAVPALVSFGVPVLIAHLVVFWSTQFATITPPVAMAAFVGAGIAEADFNKTGFAAVRMAIGLYVMPFLLIYTPLVSGDAITVLLYSISAVFGFWGLSVFMQNYMFRKLLWWERISALLAAVLFFIPAFYVQLIGLGILVFITLSQLVFFKQSQAATL